MKVFYEFASRQLNKRDEELCGDSVAFSIRPSWATLVFSDGLGSGVKACILSTLTTRIATRMLDEGLPIDEVVRTVSETLPICTVRKIAYSTFTMAQMFSDGRTSLMEYDSPPAFILHHNRLRKSPCEEFSIDGKLVRRHELEMSPGDWIVIVSDGVINAGIGGAYPMGWGWDEVGRYLENHVHEDLAAEGMAECLIQVTRDLYEGPPGDDVTVAAVKVRRWRLLTIFTGPPVRREDDAEVVKSLMAAHGKRAVCGGTAANIVARELGRRVEVELETGTQRVPPRGRIEGIDLVSEGVLTLTYALELIRAGTPMSTLKLRVDGASTLAVLLHEADEIRLLVGRAINPAHQNPDLPRDLALKSQAVHALAEELRRRGKIVEILSY